MRRWLSICLVIPGLLASGVAAQQLTAEQLARAQALTQPGPEHTRLAGLEGAWDTEIRVRATPDAEVVTTRASAENRMILGGRFLESRSVLEFFGMSGESITILGFDRRHGEYTALGLDTFGTYWVSAAGPPDGAGVIVMRGEDDDPVLGHTQIYDFVLEIHDRDRYTFSVIFHDAMHTQGRGPLKAVEIIHTRRR